MNYYAKLAEEKKNNSQIVERGHIKGVEYFIEKITETVKYPRPFEQVRYIGKLKKDGREVLYTPRHEKLDVCKRALEQLVDENKSMFNSKEEKSNGNFFLEHLKTKSFRSADELERAIKSYVAGGRVISDDADGFTVEAIDDDGKHTYKIYLREDGGTSERVTVEKVVKLNSKENSMNYYEKIIQEKRNDLQVIERGTIKGVKYFIEKITGYSRSVYRGNLEKDGRVVTSTWTCDTIDECKREINKLRDTDALLNNSKEEKRNKKQPYKQYVLEVKKYLSSYLCRILTSTGKVIYEDYADTEEEGFSKLRRVVDKYKSNSKEEKDNTSLQEWSKECEEMLKKGLSDSEIFAELRKKGLDVFDAKKVLSWTKEHKSSKEENYYAKLCEKKNLTYDTEKLAKQVKTWLSTGAYDEREIADKLEKEYGMPKSVASHTLEIGKRLRAQG